MTEGKIVSWIKSEGDRLSQGESVVVESDKADMDVEIDLLRRHFRLHRCPRRRVDIKRAIS